MDANFNGGFWKRLLAKIIKNDVLFFAMLCALAGHFMFYMAVQEQRKKACQLSVPKVIATVKDIKSYEDCKMVCGELGVKEFQIQDSSYVNSFVALCQCRNYQGQ